MVEKLPEQIDAGRQLPIWKLAAIILLPLAIVIGVIAVVRSRSNSDQPNDTIAGEETDDPADETIADPYLVSPPSLTGYVGTEACAECHQELVDSYQQHPMYNSTQHVRADVTAPSVAREASRVLGTQRLFEVDSSAGQMIHHELMYDEQGQLIYDHSVPMDYVVGSGRRAKAYVYQRDDLMFMSPLNWYAESQSWGLAPGYIKDDPTRFDRRVVDICIGCHTGQLNVAEHGVNQFADEPFQEMAIGCEKCHGPGQDHIAWHQQIASESNATDPIVNPANLTHAERESTCYQCHLQPSSDRILRHGRSNLDFRVGQQLDEIWTVLRSSSGVGSDGRTESVRHVHQMRQSRCYLESPQAMDCTSCHDPHRVPSIDERVDFYRERCNRCHDDRGCIEPLEQRQAADNSCIACHMPARDTAEMAHVSQTDHRVVRRPNQRERIDAEQMTRFFFGNHGQSLDEAETLRARTLGLTARRISRGQTADPQLKSDFLRLLESFPNDADILMSLGSIAWQERNVEQAIQYYQQASQLPKSRESALNSLIDIAYLGANYEQALQLSDALVELNPNNARIYALRGDILASLGRVEDGIEATQRALELNPTLLPTRQWLVGAYQHLGRQAEAEAEQALILRMQSAKLPEDQVEETDTSDEDEPN